MSPYDKIVEPKKQWTRYFSPTVWVAASTLQQWSAARPYSPKYTKMTIFSGTVSTTNWSAPSLVSGQLSSKISLRFFTYNEGNLIISYKFQDQSNCWLLCWIEIKRPQEQLKTTTVWNDNFEKNWNLLRNRKQLAFCRWISFNSFSSHFTISSWFGWPNKHLCTPLLRVTYIEPPKFEVKMIPKKIEWN